MSFDDYYQLGYVVKSHGLTGDVILFLDVSDPDHYHQLDVVFLENNGQLVPHFIKNIHINGDRARITFDEFDSKEKAETIVGMQAFLPTKYLPKLKKGQYYFHELVGFDIFSEGQLIGQVAEIYDLGSQTLLSTTLDGQEVLIPTNRDILQEVDLKNGTLTVSLPEGLIDLYKKP